MAKLHAIQTFYDQRLGLVTLEDDVLSIVRQVRDLYGDRVYILMDETNGYYHFVEKTDTEEKLIFTTDCLDARSLERLRRADSHSRGYVDAYDEVEKEQDELNAAHENSLRERIREPLERLIHTNKQDGLEPLMPTVMPVSGERRKVGRPSA
jgi:hypothetical protein